jgi:hypothetical protein
VTIPRRADLASGDSHVAARPNLLAELPHIGKESPAVNVASTTNTRKSTHPAFAEYALNVEVPSDESSRKQTKRYVDRPHIEEADDRGSFDSQTNSHRKDQPIANRQRNHKQKQKSAFAGLLSNAHQQLAPFAGLIVTAALVAAAGLLFHMMSGGSKSSADVDEFALPGFQVEVINEPAPSEEFIPLADVSPTPESPKPEIKITEPATLMPPDNSAQNVLDPSANTPSTLPTAASEVESTVPLGQLSFPLTETPLALDYAKASDPDLKALPEVAERTETTASEGINR